LDANTVIVYSNLLRIEFWNGWRSAVDHRGLPPEIAAEPPLLPDPVAERQRLYGVGDRYLRDFLRLFERREVRVGARLLDTALALIGRYNLKSLDACVVACALHSGVPHIASLDQGFLRVDDIELWNNDVPGRRERRRPE
jgi:predicted nucleic acid-binding protein